MKFNPILLAFGLIPLTGCGGGGGDDNTTTSTYTVKAIDGYLRNAQVWLDIDGDYQLDNDEPSALTGEGGSAELDVTNISSPEQYSVVVKTIAGQTIDEDSITETNPSGSVITSPYILSAPAGQTTITPLSSLVDIKMKNGQTQQEALTELATSLNIEETQLLEDYIENEQGDVAAKASSLVALALLPESETEMGELTDGSSNIDDTLTEDTLTSLSAIEEDQLLISDSGGSLITVNIITSDDEDYDEYADGADKDGDGIINVLDAFPDNGAETADTDNDSVGDNADAFPEDETETADTDSDGVGDNSDAFPEDATETADTDNDGVGNNTDVFPHDETETADTDNDGVGDNNDAFPNDATETVDTDGDNIGDNSDPDANGDGIIDVDKAGFEYAYIENKRLYALYPNTTEGGIYYDINTMLFNSASEALEFGFGYIDIDDNYFRDSMPWVITDGALILEDYNIRYKLIESTSDYFKVCSSSDITTDATCDDASSSYLFFDKMKAKSFISNNSTAGTPIELTQITDPNLNEYFTALEYDYIEQVYNVNIEDSNVESLAGMEQFISLEKLFAYTNHITDISPLTNFASLKYLLIPDQTDPVTGDDVNLDSYSPIYTLPSLTRLRLSGYKNHQPEEFLKLADIINGLDDKSKMTDLGLYDVEITNDDIDKIVGMPNLENLNISDTTMVDDLTALEANTWHKLERLELSWNNNSVIDTVQNNAQRVAALPLFNLDNMIASGLNISQLSTLQLAQTTLDENDLFTIASNVGENLESLDLRGVNVSDYDDLFDNLNTPNLKRLKLGIYDVIVNYNMQNINNNLIPSKLEILYLNTGNVSNFTISEFTNLQQLSLRYSNIVDSSISAFNTAVTQLAELENLRIDHLTINGEDVYCNDLTLSDSIDCYDGLPEDYIPFTTELIRGNTWYTSDFFKLEFSNDGSTLSPTSMLNSEESDANSIIYTISDGKLILDEDDELTITNQGSNFYTLNLTNSVDQTVEELVAYTSLEALEESLYTGLSDGITLIDSSNDSTNQAYAGFELKSVTAEESNNNLIVTVKADGDILTALNSPIEMNYNNSFWLGINQYIEFGFHGNGSVWLDIDIWENGEFTEGYEVAESDYSYTISDDTVTLTIPLSMIPANDYLAIKVEIGFDYIGSGDEANDDTEYDRIYLGIDW